MRSGWTRGAVAGIGAVAVLAFAGCSSAPAVEPKAEEPIAEPRGLQPPESPIADDLVVPEGAKLAGAVFAEPGQEEEVDDWTAYLVVDGDPFAVWDDLAEQVRSGEGGPMLAGSADACTWTLLDDGAAAGDGGSIEPAPLSTAEATGEQEATTTTAPPAEDPYLEAITIGASAPSEDVDGVQCSASAPAIVDGVAQQVTMQLQSGTDQPATLTLQTVWGNEGVAPGPTALRTTLERQAGPGGGPAIEPGPDPVPSGAADHVPEAAAQPVAEELGPFGPEVNCFADGGYQRLELPHGAVLVASGFSEGGTVSVLRVISVEAALTEIREQVAGDGTSDDGDGTVETVKLVDHQPVTQFDFSVSAGGGSCGALSSADGSFLVVTAHGD